MEDSKIVKITNIHEILDDKFMQNVQDFFASTMDVALLTVLNEKRLTVPSNTKDFCSKYTLGSSLGYQRCEECHLKWERESRKNNGPVIYTCHLGLANFIIPIFVKGKYMASVIGGQVLTEPPDEEHFRRVAKELGIDEKIYLSELKKVKIVPHEKLKAAVDSLNLIINSVSAIAYANFILSELGMDYKIPRNIAIEQWLFLNCENVERPLTSREFEILKLIIVGKSNPEIAKELFISVHTVKAHVSSILEKFAVEDRVQIAVKAVREGLI